jgi:hypothetical protein
MDYYYKHPATIKVAVGSEQENDLLLTKILSKDFNAPVVDRTGNINTFAVIKDPIPEMSKDTLDFNQIVDDRTNEILAQAKDSGKDIRMNWTGSLPSTVMVLSMHNAVATMDILSRPNVTVHITSKADERRKEFFNTYLTSNDYLVATKKPINSDSSTDYITMWDDTATALWKGMYIPFADHTVPFAEICEPDMLDKLQPVLDAMPAHWEKEETSSALHWLNFVFKYQWSSVRRDIQKNTANSPVQFYNSTEFQQWYMQEPILSKQPELANKESEKHCREYIKQYHNDETLGMCNFHTGRGYQNMEASKSNQQNPLTKGNKVCVGITAGSDKNDWLGTEEFEKLIKVA